MKHEIPNLFIVGAAKSATTSLYYYLKQHPEIFLSTPKEPKYFSRQVINFPQNGPGDQEVYDKKSNILTFDDYLSLFPEPGKFTYAGEASVDNLYYYSIASEIKTLFNNPTAIIVLRNPVDRAFSSYTHLVRDGRETLSFEDALAAEDGRISNNFSFMWHYKAASLYYYQVKNYIEEFGRDSVRILFFEDIKQDTNQSLKSITDFLKLSPFEYQTETKHNESGLPKNLILHSLVTQKSILKNTIKPFIPKSRRKKLKKSIRDRNIKKTTLDRDTRKYLNSYFREDLKSLSDLIQTDLLEKWLT